MRTLCFLIIPFLFCSCNKKWVQGSTDIDLGEIKAVQIDAKGFIGPCEPSICINPSNPDNIIAGSVMDNVYVSFDGGHSWTKDKLESTYGIYGDPVVRIDSKGRIYYSHLSDPSGRRWSHPDLLDRIVIQKSVDEGRTWSNGSFTTPRSPKDQDKQWMAIDPMDDILYISWTEFDLYKSKKKEDKSRVLFSRSVDHGDSWSEPIVLSQFEGDCLDNDQTTEGAVPAVGPEGEVYVSWSYNEKIYFDRSFDKGLTWLDEDKIVADQVGGWSYSIPGIYRCNGMPICGVDRSQGPNRGTIYVNWSDQRNGKDDTDIWFSSSNDHGDTWSEPLRVNDDLPGKHQFFCWMDIDQSTGYIYIVFYDRREHKDHTTDVYLAYSSDGGKSFKNTRVNKFSFTPTPHIFFGDYNDISAYKGRVRPIWTQMKDGVLSVWTAIIN